MRTTCQRHLMRGIRHLTLTENKKKKIASDIKRKFASAVMQTGNFFSIDIYVKTREKKPSQYDLF